MRRVSLACTLALVLLSARGAFAAPAHDVCADLGATLPVGVSSFSAAGDWPIAAEQQHGVDWKLLYVYVVPTSDPKPDVEAYLLGKAALARSIGAVPVYTFYELLQIGQQSGLSGSEPEVVQAVLAEPALMKRTFEEFVFLLETAEKAGPPVIVQVEPDSWGFMMWAMGVEGNADATTIPVAVKSSGHSGLESFDDDAAGLGRALLALRDRHAPSVRLGWHASNFRVGQRPDVVTGFYASMGEWDVLFTEQPHLEADETRWWEPWDRSLLATNEAWFSAVSTSAGVPLLLWQAQIGTTDFHFFDGDSTELERFAKAGLGGVLFDMRGSDNPDEFRAYESAALATVPPPESTAGGTAADMRARLAAYAKAPLAWPAGSPCAAGFAGGAAGGSAGAGGSGASSGSVGASGSGGASGASVAPTGAEQGEGCGCRTAGSRGAPRWAVALSLALLVLRRMRRSQFVLETEASRRRSH
jgi:MYXO-CTERM domain-containing protein